MCVPEHNSHFTLPLDAGTLEPALLSHMKVGGS